MSFQSGKTVIECPFCKKVGIAAFHWPQRREAHVSRISNKSATTYSIKPEKYDILSDCPNCGKTKREIENFFEGKTKEKRTHEERLERLKKRGLPLVIEG
jgi:sarcosine oxidase delta subunit